MLLIHKPRNHKLLILVITSVCCISALLGLSVLTYTPELSHAEQVTYPSLSNITYMQDMTADICKHSHENETKQLIDSRDGKTYWVTKLKDENCWMTQNLDLDLYVDGANRKLTSADSDVTTDWTSTTGASGLWATSGSDYNMVKYYDPGEYVYTNPTNRLDSGCGLLNSDTCKNAGWELMSGASTNESGSETTHYLTGNYYTWGAATAGQASTINAAGESTQSICPKGWRLPINSGDKSYTNLFAAYGTLSELSTGRQDVRLAPFYFVYGGNVGGGSSALVGAGNSGFYWSSATYNSDSVYLLAFNTSVNPSYTLGRHYGFSVRCIARTDPPETRTLSDLTYMQDMTMDVCKNSDIEETKQLIDKRDDKTYWVTKLKDNNCWMTQNLALDLSNSTPLTPADSDVSTSWTPPASTQQDTITKFPSSSDKTFSYDPGEYVYTTPLEQHNCGSSGIAKLEGCPNWKLTSGLSKDIGNNKQAHYLAGNYYSYEVATAGSAPASGGASSSICPKGWRLPNTDNYTNLTNGLTASMTDTANNIKLAPYYFLYGGYINSGLHLAGSEGRYWSSLAHNNGNSAYFLDFDISILPPRSSANPRSSGFSVRCVSPGGEKAIIDNNNIKVTINPQLALDVASETIVNKTDANPSTGDLKVKVSSNQPYIVQLSSNDATMKSNTTSATIPAKSGLLNTAENGWGIMKHGASEYTAITNTPELFYQSASPEVKELLLKVGISTAPDIPNGEYSTDITITATQN